MFIDRFSEDKLTGCIDDIRKQNEHGYQKEIPVAENHLECADRLQRLLKPADPGRIALAALDPVCQQHADGQQDRRNQHHRVRSDRYEEPACNCSAKDGA